VSVIDVATRKRIADIPTGAGAWGVAIER